MSNLVKAIIIILLSVGIFGTAGYFGYDIFVKPAKIEQQQRLEAVVAPTPPPDPSLPEFEKIVATKNSGDLPAARVALESFIENNPESTKLEEAKTLLGTINTDLFFSTAPDPEKVEYTIVRGDALVKIERKLKTTAELIMRQNNLTDPTKLQIGQVLRVSNPEFSLKIDRKNKKLVLFNKGRFFKQYIPKTWSGPAAKPGAPNSPPITSKVTEKIAWRNGNRVAFGSKDYAGSARWVVIATPGFTIYSEAADPSEPTEKPPSGIGLSMEDAEELSTLVSRGVPVTIE